MKICDILIECFHSKSETEHFSGNMIFERPLGPHECKYLTSLKWQSIISYFTFLHVKSPKNNQTENNLTIIHSYADDSIKLKW